MCGIQEHKYQRPLTQLDVLPISKYYQIRFDLCQKIFEAMTDFEVPEVAAFVLIIEALKRYQEQDYGINQDFGPWIPLSAISLDNSFTRYRTAEMQTFHDAFIAFNMSERNRNLVDGVLATETNTKLVTMHSCGIVIVPLNKVTEFMNSKLHKTRNFLRSRSNSIGTPLVLVDSFESIPVEVDMGESEFLSYNRAWNILHTLPNNNTATNENDITTKLEFLKQNRQAHIQVAS